MVINPSIPSSTALSNDGALRRAYASANTAMRTVSFEVNDGRSERRRDLL